MLHGATAGLLAFAHTSLSHLLPYSLHLNSTMTVLFQPPPTEKKACWPFHRSACRPNQFADAVEAAEPKFAGWMRGHGKLAVLKDDEVCMASFFPPRTSAASVCFVYGLPKHLKDWLCNKSGG